MKKPAILSLVIALILTVLLPVSALAAKTVPFIAQGIVTGITPGDVFPAGDSGRFVVADRTISGVFVSGDIPAWQSFSFAYKANVVLGTQAGNLHGTLQSGSLVMNVEATTPGVQIIGVTDDGYLAVIPTNGYWNFTEGAYGGGKFQSETNLLLSFEGHVLAITGGSVSLTGQWQP